ncbi:DUF4113 domain-containing protein [Pseudarthrobacter siccitolerans]
MPWIRRTRSRRHKAGPVPWQVKRNNVSPRVTTQWDELATAKAA